LTVSQNDFHDSQISFRDSQIGFRDSQIDFRDSQIGFRDSQIDFRDSQIGFDDSQIGFRDSQIDFRDRQIGFDDRNRGKLTQENHAIWDLISLEPLMQARSIFLGGWVLVEGGAAIGRKAEFLQRFGGVPVIIQN
jgi:hypothetical protein